MMIQFPVGGWRAMGGVQPVGWAGPREPRCARSAVTQGTGRVELGHERSSCLPAGPDVRAGHHGHGPCVPARTAADVPAEVRSQAGGEWVGAWRRMQAERLLSYASQDAFSWPA